MNLCEVCKTVLLEPHPELELWDKCPCCGFCRINAERRSKLPDVDIYVKKPQLMIQELWKDKIIYK